MSVEGIQICVDGVEEAMVAVRPHRANAASEIPIRWMILPLFFMVPPVLPAEGVPQGAYFAREWGALLGRYNVVTPLGEHPPCHREGNGGRCEITNRKKKG